jgi:hypothetical protein
MWAFITDSPNKSAAAPTSSPRGRRNEPTTEPRI